MIILYVVVYAVCLVTMLITRVSFSVAFITFVIVTWLMSGLSVAFWIIGVVAEKKSRLCTEHTVGTYTKYFKGSKDAPGDYYAFRYQTPDGEIVANVAAEFTEGVIPDRLGTEHDIWYNPLKTSQFIVCADGKLSTVQREFKKHGKPGIIVNLLCIAIVVLYFAVFIRL